MKLKQPYIDGVKFTPIMIRGYVEPIAELRQILLQQDIFEYAVSLSYIVFLLNYLADNTEEE